MIGRWGRKSANEGAKVAPRTGLLARLGRDRRGNTMAMMAALIIPLLGMVGGGVDMARGYMTRAKLQTACDSTALAARRVMGATAFSVDANNDGTPDAEAEGRRFFAFNFPEGTMGTAPVTLVIRQSPTDASVVEVTANTTLPTTIMGMFGTSQLAIAVTCEADKDFVNNDVMLVLDVTRSMNCEAGTSCSDRATEAANSRVARLRTAALSLYDELDDAVGVRTRYGFMPYSMNVNPGLSMNTNWLIGGSSSNLANYWYQSGTWRTRTKQFNFTTMTNATSTPNGFCVEERSSVGNNNFGSAATIATTVTQNDIDQLPASTATSENRYRWQPYYASTTDGTAPVTTTDALQFYCPRPARRLATYSTRALFQTALLDSVGRAAGQPGYVATVDGVARGGYTMHDVGMVWGMRFLSGTGMFTADNPDTFDATADGVNNPIRVARHIIFLTDGPATQEAATTYSMFGVRNSRDRIAGTGTVVQRHQTRFRAACERARQMGFTIWVIVLDDGSEGDVSHCASDSAHFFESDGTDLASIFQLIGRGIGRLRLTQ